MHRYHFRSLLVLLFSLMLPLVSSTAYAKIACWTNNDGVRECGNAVPPEYAQKETQIVNDKGRITEVKERAKTPEEVAAAKAVKKEEERLAAVEEERQAAKDAYDQMLLSTYLTEDDIKRSRERQSGAIDASIGITDKTIVKLQDKLAAEKKKAADLERAGKKIPARQQQDIQELQGEIEDKNNFIQRKKLEQVELHKKYDADLARFLELKADGVKLH